MEHLGLFLMGAGSLALKGGESKMERGTYLLEMCPGFL